MPGTFRFRRMTKGVARSRATLALCAASMFITLGAPASADVCSDLRAEIASLANAGTGTTTQAARYDEAAQRQRTEIAKTRAIQQAQNCFAAPSATCQALNLTLQRMQANLDALERQRDRFLVRPNVTRMRVLTTRLKANRCDEPQRMARLEEPARPSSVTVIPNDKPDAREMTRVIVREGAGRERVGEVQRGGPLVLDDPNAVPAPQLSGTFRTLCVRTCDGYYFPISFATTSNYFERDAKACSAMCPATEAKLYFHRIPGEESEDMISMRGEPYSSLPNAFLYRRRSTDKADPSCTCGTAASVPATQQQTAEPLATDGLPDVEARRSDNDKSLAEVPPVDTRAERKADADRKVRVVGPEFLPAPKEASDLRSPDRTPAL